MSSEIRIRVKPDNWDDLGILMRHNKMRSFINKPIICPICNTKKYNIELTNLNHCYRFILDEWEYKCQSCHHKYDLLMNLIQSNGKPETKEVRIRVPIIISERLWDLKKETGLSINYYVNYALTKQLFLDKIIKRWELNFKPKKQKELDAYINKLPEDLKIDYLKETEKPKQKPLVYANQDKGDMKNIE